MGFREDLETARRAYEAAELVYNKEKTETEAARAEYDREKSESDAAKMQRDAAKAAYDAMLAQRVQGAVDISQHNYDRGEVNFAEIRAAGYEVLFHRVAEGDFKDPAWFGNPNKADAVREAGLILGTYYFAHVANPGNSQRNGKSEAAMAVYFAEARGGLKAGDLPLAYDFENESIEGQTPAKVAKHVMEFVRAYHYLKGTPPIVYTNPSTWNSFALHLSADDRAFLGTCPLWEAHYGVQNPDPLPPWPNWTFWQYTSTGTVEGLEGAADLNHFSGDKTLLHSMKIQPA